MTTSSRGALVELLLLALAEPIGLLVKTSDPAKLRASLYRARQASGDPDLSGLQIRMSPLPGGELVLCKSTPVDLASPAPMAPPSVEELL